MKELRREYTLYNGQKQYLTTNDNTDNSISVKATRKNIIDALLCTETEFELYETLKYYKTISKKELLEIAEKQNLLF